MAVGIVGGLAAVLNPVTLDPIAGVSAAGTVRYYIATSGNVRPFGGGFGGIVAISDGTTNITIPYSVSLAEQNCGSAIQNYG